MTKKNDISELELTMMKLIGELPKVINIPIKWNEYKHGVRFDELKNALESRKHSPEEINQALNNLRNKKYVGEIKIPESPYKNGNEVHCIALTGQAIREYNIRYD